MIRFVITVMTLLAGMFTGYHLMIRAMPGVMMSGVYAKFNDAGMPVNAFAPPRMITAENQTIVRSSPDLVYSICLIDVSGGPVRIRGRAWAGYASLTVFDMNTNAVLVGSLDSRTDVVIEEIIVGDGGDVSIEGNKAIALIRRFALDAERFAGAQYIANGIFAS